MLAPCSLLSYGQYCVTTSFVYNYNSLLLCRPALTSTKVKCRCVYHLSPNINILLGSRPVVSLDMYSTPQTAGLWSDEGLMSPIYDPFS